MTPADELRAAAEKLRALSQAATEGPWRCIPNETAVEVWSRSAKWELASVGTDEDAAYVAAMHPGVGLALAAWLDGTARSLDGSSTYDAPDCPNCGTACSGHPAALWCDGCGGAINSPDYTGDAACQCWEAALAAARLINGGVS